MALDGAAGVSGVFGVWRRIRLRLVAAFFALCGFWAARVGRFAVVFTRAVLWPRFVGLVLVARGFAMRTFYRKRFLVSRKRVGRQRSWTQWSGCVLLEGW